MDVKDPYLQTFRRSHSDAMAINADLSGGGVERVLDRHGVNLEEVDILIGGPPCKGFSTVGDRRVDDPRNNMVMVFANAVKTMKPPAFLMENVPGMASMKDEQGNLVVNELKKVFKEIGYETSNKLVQSVKFGVPQRRERLIFVGVRGDIDASFSFPKPTHFPKSSLEVQVNDGKRYLHVRDAISDLPSLASGEEATSYQSNPQTPYQKKMRRGAQRVTNHIAPDHSDTVLKRIRALEQGENHADLPEDLKLDSGYPNIYGRLEWDQPADTITANFGAVSAPGRFIHPKDHRGLTVREGARLQSFPDRVKFYGPRTLQYKQVGNAVPPLLAEKLAMELKETLRRGDK